MDVGHYADVRAAPAPSFVLFTRECNKRALAALVSALMCDAQCMSLFVVDVGRCPSTTVDTALVFDRVSEAKYSPFPGSTPRRRILH